MTVMLKMLITRLIKNAISMALTKKIALWALRLAVKQTDTKIDDNCVSLVEGLYDKDDEKVMKAIEDLTKALKS